MTKMRTLTGKLLSQIKHDMRTGRLPVERQHVSDDVVPGLLVMVRRHGPHFFTFRKPGADIRAYVPVASLAEARRMVTSA